jgi:hypothetical protein
MSSKRAKVGLFGRRVMNLMCRALLVRHYYPFGNARMAILGLEAMKNLAFQIPEERFFA